MQLKFVKLGMSVIVSKEGHPHDGMEGEVLSIRSDLTGAEHIRILILETGEVLIGFKASDLET